ncbi:GlcG/HbpS family heme-binding protein [Pseudoduganella lutea]|uniref:Heme-binding protein n=1 Tax=Pseudoduganella lutea TaxID=321985 RepID=A0A4P6KTW9_9BURK|nr:heme-binding protein [Pseudoduganella lutea]QBE62134.1 heme-binding protein [Pseudoduganella lutea]
MPKPTAHLLALLAMLAALPAGAQVRQQGDLTLESANRLVAGALDACRRQDRAIVATVLDRGGNLLALQRAETVGPHNTEASRRKAYTALSTRTATLDLARAAAANPDARNLATLPELLLLGGGVPVMAAGQVVGAIGVAGGGGATNDHACALAAIRAVDGLDRPAAP